MAIYTFNTLERAVAFMANATCTWEQEPDGTHTVRTGDDMDAEYRLVPQVISRRQFFLAAYRAGILESIERLVAESDPLVRLTFQHATEFRRDDAMLNACAAALGKTDAEVDAVFIQAGTL